MDTITTDATDFTPKPRDLAGTAWISLKIATDANKANDIYMRNEFLIQARRDLEEAGETLAADFIEEYLSQHAYFSHVVPVIMAYLAKKYDFR